MWRLFVFEPAVLPKAEMLISMFWVSPPEYLLLLI